MDKHQRQAYTQQIRERIADALTLPMLKSLGKGAIYELMKASTPNVDDDTLLNMYKNEIKTEWVNEFGLELLQNVYQCNIIVIKDHDLYRTFQNDFKYDNNIFILWVDESHYEVLGYHIDDVLIAYVVLNQHPFIQKLRSE
jgi:hypothetical protein